MTETHATAAFKAGPKGKILEPHSAEILTMYQQGKSGQDIVKWLAAEPRRITISRQAVHEWVGRRVAKLKARAYELGAAANVLQRTLHSISPPSAVGVVRADVFERAGSSMPLPTDSTAQSPAVSIQPGRIKLRPAPKPEGFVGSSLASEKRSASQRAIEALGAAKTAAEVNDKGASGVDAY